VAAGRRTLTHADSCGASARSGGLLFSLCFDVARYACTRRLLAVGRSVAASCHTAPGFDSPTWWCLPPRRRETSSIDTTSPTGDASYTTSSACWQSKPTLHSNLLLREMPLSPGSNARPSVVGVLLTYCHLLSAIVARRWPQTTQSITQSSNHRRGGIDTRSIRCGLLLPLRRGLCVPVRCSIFIFDEYAWC